MPRAVLVISIPLSIKCSGISRLARAHAAAAAAFMNAEMANDDKARRWVRELILEFRQQD